MQQGLSGRLALVPKHYDAVGRQDEPLGIGNRGTVPLPRYKLLRYGS